MRCALCLMSLLLLISGCNRGDTGWCLRVGQTTVTSAEFHDQLERFAEESMIDSREMLNQMKPTLVSSLLEQQLILEYARDKGITVSDEEVSIALDGYLEGISREDLDRVLTEECRRIDDIHDFIRKRSVCDKAIERAVRRNITVEEKTISAYYEEHRAEFMRPASVELYHVYVRDKYRAKEAQVMLRSGVSLGEVVRRYSESADAKDTGFMGVFTKGELPHEVEKVAFSIPERRYSGIIATMRGYHIFYVERRTPAGVMPLAEVHDLIRERLQEQRFEQAYAMWIDNLKEQYQPEVNWDEIKRITLN